MNDTTHPSRQKFIDAATALIREKGYAGTSVDDICARAGLRKGSFFHHFKSKEELLLAAIEHWNNFTGWQIRAIDCSAMSTCAWIFWTARSPNFPVCLVL